MLTKSWLVTLTPLIVALLQLAESYLTGDGLSGDKLYVFITLLLTFVGSGAVGKMNSKKSIG